MGRKNTPFDILDRVDISDNQGCWPWKGPCSASGYGKTHYNGEEWRAHRLAYFLYHKKVPQVCRHICDNRKCCNPFHLLDGTHKDNMKDMSSRKRASRQKGETHGQSKFKDKDIIEMREMFKNGHHPKEIAVRFKTIASYVFQIVRRKRWSHV